MKKTKPKLDFKPDAIIITLPVKFFDTYPGGEEKFERVLKQVDAGNMVWFNTIGGGVPALEVEFVYMVIGGRIRYRFTALEFLAKKHVVVDDVGDSKERVEFFSGTGKPRNWVKLGGPVIEPDRLYERKGFQGFRYTEFLF